MVLYSTVRNVLLGTGSTGCLPQLDFITFTNISKRSTAHLSSFHGWLADCRNEYYNSKAGHAYLEKLEAEEAEKAKQARQHTKG